jgi:hypothetical protein
MNQKEILILIFVILIISIGGFLIYNEMLISEKPPVSEEETLSDLTISAPSELEVVAYKKSSFNFSIKNERKDSLKDVNITLDGVSGEVTPNNIEITPNDLQTFEVKVDKVTPGDYTLFLKIQAKPDVDITKTISLKSQVVVGLDGYHNYNYDGIGNCWRKEFETEKSLGPLINETPSHPFVQYISKECRNHYCAGRYYPFAENLEQVGIKTEIIESPFSSDMFDKINVLVLLPPYIGREFSFTEKDELEKFLNKGGGLLLVEPGYFNCSAVNPNFKDLIEKLHLNVSLGIHRKCARGEEYPTIKEIEEFSKWSLEHQITAPGEAFPYSGFFVLRVKPPMTSLIELNKGETIYAIQRYAKGKIGIISSTMQLELRYAITGMLHYNLINWLAEPEVYEEMG